MSENITLRTNLAVRQSADGTITALVGWSQTKIPVRVTRFDAHRLRLGDADVRTIIATTIEDGEVTHLVTGKGDLNWRRQQLDQALKRL